MPQPAGYPLKPVFKRLARVALTVALLTLAGTLLTTAEGHIATIWLVSGYVVCVLLPLRIAQWPLYIGATYLGNVAGNLIGGGPIDLAASLALCSPIEILITALGLRYFCGPRPDAGQTSFFIVFGLTGVVLGTGITACLGAWILHERAGQPFGQAFLYWYAADALGLGLVVPVVTIFRDQQFAALFARPLRRTALSYLGAVAIVTLIALLPRSHPTLYLFFPPLMMTVLRLGLPGAIAAALIVAIEIVGFTLMGLGPFIQFLHDPLPVKILYMQAFIAIVLLTALPAGLVVTRRDRLYQAFERSEGRYRLMAEHAVDGIAHLDLDGTYRYVSPGFTRILGWTPRDIVGTSILDQIHADHRHLLKQILAGLSTIQERASLIYPYRQSFGDYVWIESNFGVVRDETGEEPAEIVAIMRDISRRREAEEQLSEANRRLELLATTDALTGVANRRRLDTFLADEWRRSRRLRAGLALLLLDLDYFKAYNDRYGHAAGDSCLRLVGATITRAIRRDSDLAARYGGEEFAIVLTDTTLAGAEIVARNIIGAVAALAVTHEGSPLGMLTVSAGVALLVPEHGATQSDLLEEADRALYQAKRAGRNRVMVAQALQGQLPAPGEGTARSDS